MKKRLQLINGYKNGTLTKKEIAIAEANSVVMSAINSKDTIAKKSKKKKK